MANIFFEVKGKTVQFSLCLKIPPCGILKKLSQIAGQAGNIFCVVLHLYNLM